MKTKAKHTEAPELPQPPIRNYMLAGRAMLMEDHGHRRVALKAGHEFHLEICAEDGRLRRCEPGEPFLTRLAQCYNACAGINPEAIPDMLAILKATLDDLRRGKLEGESAEAATENIKAVIEQAEKRK